MLAASCAIVSIKAVMIFEMNKIFHLALFLFSLFGSTATLGMTDMQVEQELTRVVRQMSTKFPMVIGDSTVFGAYAGPGRRITYLVVQAIPAREWTSEMLAHSQRIALNAYCTDPTMAGFIEFGVVKVTKISDQQGVHITTNAVSPRECRR